MIEGVLDSGLRRVTISDFRFQISDFIMRLRLAEQVRLQEFELAIRNSESENRNRTLKFASEIRILNLKFESKVRISICSLKI